MNVPRQPSAPGYQEPSPAMPPGGTFVRPGAVAWTRPDTPSVTDDCPLVEQALTDAAKDPDRIGDLLDELSRARVWVPLPDPDHGSPVTDGSAVRLPLVTYLGEELVPVFTSAARLAAWAGNPLVPAQPGPEARTCPHIVVPAAELARRLPPAVGIALNPGAEASLPIHAEGIIRLASVTATDVRVGHPPADPAGLLDAIRAGLREIPQVRHASRAWVRVPERSEGLVISVALDDPGEARAQLAVIAAVEDAAAAVPHDFPIDVAFAGETPPDILDKWLAVHGEPFHVA
jgi:SseB protein N-terminal domain/SseB protein C-terminal domain